MWLVLMFLLTVNGSETDPQPLVSLERVSLSEDFPHGFSRPRLFRVYRNAPYPITATPLEEGAPTWFGWLPLNTSPPAAFLLHGIELSDPGTAALYLDQNGNGDFTDDPPPSQGKLQIRDHRLVFFFSSIAYEFREPDADPSGPRLTCSVQFEIEQNTLKPLAGSFFSRDGFRASVTTEVGPRYLHLLDRDCNNQPSQNDGWALTRLDQESPPRQAEEWTSILDSILLGPNSVMLLEEVAPDWTGIRVRKTPVKKAFPGIYPPLPNRLKSERSVPWLNNFNQAKTMALKAKKPIFLLLTLPGEPLGQHYLNETFMDADVVDLLGETVPLHLEVSAAHPLLKNLEIPGFPFAILLGSHGAILKRWAGQLSAHQLARELRAMLFRLF